MFVGRAIAKKEIVGGKRKLDRDEAGFVGEVKSLFYLFNN